MGVCCACRADFQFEPIRAAPKPDLLHLEERAHEHHQLPENVGMACGSPADLQSQTKPP